MIDTENILKAALSQALETMAFLDIMPKEEDLAVPKRVISAEISFSGQKSGIIQMLAGNDFCKTLAQNIAVLDEVDDTVCLDALQELSNVTCGLLLSMIASSPADVFDITIPSVGYSENQSLWDEFRTDENCCLLNVEGFLVATKLIIND